MADTKLNKEITIAILPFELLDSGEDLPVVIRGFAEDLTVALSRFIGLSVISHYSTRHIRDISDREAINTLSAQYLVSGSFRKLKETLRVGVHLIRSNNMTVAFSRQYEERLDGILDARDDMVQQIVSVLQQQLDYDLLSHSFQKKSVQLAAYENWLLGMELLKKGSLENDLNARNYFQKALEIDPGFARAYTGMSLSYFNEWTCQLWDRWDVSQKGAHEYALKALEVDANDYLSLAVLGRTYLFSEEYNKAEHYLRKSLRMNPNDANNLITIAFSMMFLGYTQEAEKLYRKACFLNPLHGEVYFAYGSNIYFEMGQYERSLEVGKKVAADTVWVDFPLYLAAAHYYLDDHEQMLRYWDLFLLQYEKFISRGEAVTSEAALEWHIKVNPYREKTQLEDFRNYIASKGSREISAGSVSDTAAKPAAFLRKGAFWEVSFQSESVLVKDAKGIHDLVRLLREPEKEWHCTELMEAKLVDQTVTEALDAKALSDYRARIRDLREDIEEAEAMNRIEVTARLKTEYETLLNHLSRSLNAKGTSRRIGTSVEKARAAVTWRIRSAIKKIEQQHPALGKHLSNSVKTGNFCAYRPELPLTWEIEKG